MATYEAEYSKHGTLTPGEIDHVYFVSESAYAHELLIVANHGDVPIYFDYTYPGGEPPVDDIVPGMDNTFMVLPKDKLAWKPNHEISEFHLIADAACGYTIQFLD